MEADYAKAGKPPRLFASGESAEERIGGTFFAAHAAHLVPLHDVAINAWQDANAMDPDTHFIASEFWASWINEIVCVVAGLVGGYNHRRNVSPRIRTLLYPKWQREAAEPQSCSDEAQLNHSLQ